MSDGLKKLPLIVLVIVLVCSAMPYLLNLVGVSYAPASKGGAGAHFASFILDGNLIRMDVAAAGLLLLLSALNFLYYRIAPSRFISIMVASLIMGGMALAVLIVPLINDHSPAKAFNVQAVHSLTLGYLGLGLLLLNGAFFVRFGIRGDTRLVLAPVLTTGLIILGCTWALMSGAMGGLFGYQNQLQQASIGIFVLTGILLKPNLNPRVLGFFKLSLIGMLIPLIIGVLWLHLGTSSIFDQGAPIATLLWWMALLLPVLGLGIDYINTYYSKGMASEKHFLRQVVDAIPHFIFSRDKNGYFTLVNKAVADFYGLTISQVEGKHLSDIHIDPVQKDEWLEEDQRIFAEGITATMDTTETHDSEGNSIWIDAIKTLLVGSGFQNQVLGISIDITRQKQAEKALARRLHFEQIATTILRKFVKCHLGNMDRNMVDILHSVAEFTQADSSFIYQIGSEKTGANLLHRWQKNSKTQTEALPPELSSEQTAWMVPLLQSGKPIRAHRLSDLPEEAGEFLKAWSGPEDSGLFLTPIINHEELFGFLGLETTRHQEWSKDESYLMRNIVDLFITVWTKLETENNLIAAMQEAQASSRAKTEFLANMSHEIRTPMNCVIGISELLREMDPTAGQRQYLDMISQSGDSLLALINDILDLSKIEAGQLELDPVETNLRNLVEEAVGLIAFNAQAKGLEMVCRYAPGAPDLVVCDPNRLRQVLTNLLNNAFKFTKTGHLYLNVEPVGQKDGLLEMQFQLTDTGIGISQQKLEKIFDKFTQADTSTTRRFGGTGLGLSISQKLVDLMGGAISAESHEGQGSTFTFIIPVEEVPGSLQAPDHVAEPDSSILVISAHELGGEVLAEQVRHLGYESEIALGSQEGVQLIEQMVDNGKKPYAFILIDQDALPKEAPLLRQFLNCLPLDCRPILILMTSLSCIVRESDLARDGFTSTLTKPVRPGRLAEVLNGAEGVELVTQVAEQSVTTEVMDLEMDQESDTATEGQPKILLAEDNPFNQKVATGMLKLLGCHVQLANNGVEALEMVQQDQYDVLFMDCQMPEMDGYEATREIRKLTGSAGKTTIIAMTANALSGDRNACFESGMDDFLSKPITKAMLSDMLAKWDLLLAPVSK